MSAKTYLFANAPMQTIAAPVPVTTGTTVKTMLQVSTPATATMRIVEWGISFDGSVAATPIRVELLQTDVAATVTAAASVDVTKHNDPNAPASAVTLGVAATGYTATAEGTITATRTLDLQLVSPTSGYVKQFPLGREPEIPISKFARIRVTAPVAVNAYCYVIWEE